MAARAARACHFAYCRCQSGVYGGLPGGCKACQGWNWFTVFRAVPSEPATKPKSARLTLWFEVAVTLDHKPSPAELALWDLISHFELADRPS